MLNKVPEITVYFWLIKVLCTTVGETFADNLNENLGLGLSGTSYLMGALVAEGRAPRRVQRRAASATTGASHQAERPKAQTTAVRPIATSAARARRGSSPTTKSQIATRMRRALIPAPLR